MSIIKSLSKKSFGLIVKKSVSYADICRNLGLRRQSGYYRTIQKRIKNDGIDINHFLPVTELFSKNYNFMWINKEDFLIRLNSDKEICEDTLKKKLIEFNLIPHKCKCGIESEWCKEKLILQLDHIDGNHNNNRLENLRWLCPNCHSQTKTFCGKHKKTKKHSFKITNKRGFNLKYNRHIWPSKRPSKEELVKTLGTMSFRKMGKKYGVTDNAVKKWCKFYGLPCRKKDLVGDSGVEPLNEVCKTSGLPLA